METVYLWIVLFPLLGSLISGLFRHQVGRAGSHWIATLGVGLSFVLCLVVFYHSAILGAEPFNGSVYTWAVVGNLTMEIGFLVDNLTALMITVVTFVSLMVHIYTIGYMHDEDGYQKFFSYISLFTFAMLMLVMSNNLLQLFFGWEAVGLVSYLLIGFYHKKESAIRANLKAFLVNRVGDFGFLLGIAGVVYVFNTLDYAEIFAAAGQHRDATVQVIPGVDWHLMTVVCLLLFIGAMGKSAQVPLHVWLPDSMEGPTPISALIHAATMVTAGIFMVARMSPLFELSEVALSTILVIGAITALFMGILGMVQNDIKRVVAYSTLSQLGYMTAALGASAYSAAIFHLMTHAFFKALLFLAAGSVIIALHHEQNIQKMGGLRRYLPITWMCFLLGSIALVALPGFSGYFSKDVIIEAVHAADRPGAGLAYVFLLMGVFITAFYSTRLYWLVFHGQERMGAQAKAHLHESPWVVTVPLILLAIPSVIIGYITVGPVLFGDFFQGVIAVAPENDVMYKMAEKFHGAFAFLLHGFVVLPFWLAIAGIGAAYFLYAVRPELLDQYKERLAPLHRVLEHKYYFDDINQWLFARGGVSVGRGLWKYADAGLIDGLVVNGTAKTVGWVAGLVRHVQSGFLYHYAFAMILGLLGLLTWAVMR